MEGERVWIETAEGRIKHVVGLTKMLPGVVSVEHGWWHPEQSAAEPLLGGVWQSNANLLTNAEVEVCDPILGQWSYRDLRCKVYKVGEIALRQANPDDRAALVALLAESNMDYTDPPENYILVVVDGNIAGCGRIEDHGHMAMLRPLVVAASYRGCGVGRRILESIMLADKPTGLVARGEAVTFYKTLGFSRSDWKIMPASQRAECEDCLNRAECKPQPMIHIPAEPTQ